MGRDPGSGPEAQLKLPPGFRFYPTDEELVVHYLCKRAASQPFAVPIIAEVDLYKFDPWDLPEKALLGEKEWYFFSPRDRKYPNGSRPNRAAGSGYWKATGTDKPISSFGGTQKVGVKKALVFYKGRAPKGVKTNWIMHEYRLADSGSKSTKKKGSLRLDDWVLCRIYKKTSSAQKAARENSESSCLDEVLASLPDIDDTKLMNLPGLSSLKGGAMEAQDVKPNVSAYSGMNQAGGNASRSAQYSGCSPATMLQSGNIGLSYNRAGISQAGMETVGIGVLNTCSQECAQSSHGGSSCYNVPRLSNEESRQHSPVDSIEEDSAVESTFTSLPSFSLAGHQTAGSYGQSEPFSFPFSFDGLPSPFSRLEPLGWGDGGYFTSLGSDYLQRPAS